MKTTPARRTVLFSAAFIALAASGARAENGLTAAPILNRPIDARSSGMGRAFTAVPGYGESVMYNPAGPAFASAPRASLSYMNGFAGGAYGFAQASFRAGNYVLTPAFLYYNSGKMSLNRSDGTKGDVTAELDKVSMLSAAFKVLPELAVGATVKSASIDLAETASASSLNYDLGALYVMKNGLSFGASSMNNGGSMKFEEKSDPAPSTLRAGAYYKTEIDPPNFLDRSADVSYCDVVLVSDWSRVNKEKGYFQSGLEMNMQMPNTVFLSLRAGYLFNRTENGFVFGFGIKNGRWDFGFAFESADKLQSRRPVTVSYTF